MLDIGWQENIYGYTKAIIMGYIVIWWDIKK